MILLCKIPLCNFYNELDIFLSTTRQSEESLLPSSSSLLFLLPPTVVSCTAEQLRCEGAILSRSLHVLLPRLLRRCRGRVPTLPRIRAEGSLADVVATSGCRQLGELAVWTCRGAPHVLDDVVDLIADLAIGSVRLEIITAFPHPCEGNCVFSR